MNHKESGGNIGWSLVPSKLERIREAGSWIFQDFESPDDGLVPEEMRVGATRRFLGCWVTPGSASLLPSLSDSLRFPNTPLEDAEACGVLETGVCGGVVRGRGSVAGCAECATVTDGTLPSVGVGLFTTPAGFCWTED